MNISGKKITIFTNPKQIISSLPFKLFIVILGCFILGDFISEQAKAFFLSVSLLIRGILLFILPIIIFSFAFYSFARLKTGLITFTILLFSITCISTFIAVMSSYCVSTLLENIININITKNVSYEHPVLNPLFLLPLPKLFDNTLSLMLGILLGIYTSQQNNLKLLNIAKKFTDVVNIILNNIFIPILPIFVLGFILKLQYEGTLTTVFKNFLPLLLVMLTLFIVYIGIGYLITVSFDIKNMIKAINNMIPASIIGFSTMSSIAALPLITSGAMKNSKNPQLVQNIIPLIINPHMLGCALAIPLMALSLYVVKYNTMPDLSMYIMFAISYVIAKFASAGIPGGAIIVIIPVLEAKLQFTPEMSGTIYMIYILCNPFITCTNIFGNGLFTMVFEKIWYKFMAITNKSQ